ncbi:hypothetical protein CJ010_07955 [Azoarcus sp. DD4]|uniref:type VI secretion system baseplate subunit TssG n=1 Tax=Azoarcus sp. DD4 TaxID=2027405 RepID=UPI00112EEE3A|nr:type VI secretion system baseplate subunit TssG [Azoarcus sp. DD4]QDF99671.1 hypothetical protein CJ010_07955 [Azoarcus sp. DD4]
MGTALGRSRRDLNRELAQEPCQFGFFQAVRLLALAQPDIPARRDYLPPALRFRTSVSLAFPASEVAGFRGEPAAVAEHQAAAPAELTVSFIGLTGPSGVLPTAYTELLSDRRLHGRDAASHAFLDVFNHRIVALFHAAWRKYRPWLVAEAGGDDDFAAQLLAVCGLGSPALRASLARGAERGLSLSVVLRYAGLLSQKPLSADALATVLRGVLGVELELTSFVGNWIALSPQERSRLGVGACELGSGAFCGDRAWDRQGKMGLRIGPVRRPLFDRLLPGGSRAELLRDLLRFAFGHALACDLTVVLDARDVRPARLMEEGAPVLGGDAWCCSRQDGADADDLRYALLA